MGKKLIIKGADFSSVAVDSLLTLDSIAWENLSYRDIFETNNLLRINPGFESGNYSPLIVNAGAPTVTSEVSDSGTYSLKVFGTTSQQLKLTDSGTQLIRYYIGVRVNCVRYQAGKIGVFIGSYGAFATAETNGFVTLTETRTVGTLSDSWFVGSASSANLDGYIDTPSVVPSSLFISVPTLEQFTQLYNQYVAIKKGA